MPTGRDLRYDDLTSLDQEVEVHNVRDVVKDLRKPRWTGGRRGFRMSGAGCILFTTDEGNFMTDLFFKIGRPELSTVYICLDSALTVRTIEDVQSEVDRNTTYAVLSLDNGITINVPGVKAEDIAVAIEKLWERNRAKHAGPRGLHLERVYPGGGTTPSGDAYSHVPDSVGNDGGSDRSGGSDRGPGQD